MSAKNCLYMFCVIFINCLEVCDYLRTSLVAQMVKRLPTMRETQVQSLGWEDPLEKEMAPLQYSCLENPMDRGVW